MPASSFIARRIHASDSSGFTRVIVRLGMITVALCICVLLMASFFIDGFQDEITNKVFNFWGHVHITHVDSDRSMDVVPIDRRAKHINDLLEVDGVEYMNPNQQMVTTQGGISEAHPFIHHQAIISSRTAFDGVICKGVDSTFNWSFMLEYLTDGQIFQSDTSAYHSNCLISSIQANRLEVQAGDKLILHFIIDGVEIKRRVTVSGVYNTGLEEYDEKFVLVDMGLLQNVLQWEPYQVSGFSVFLDDIQDLRPINEFIYIEKLPPEQYSETVRSKFPGIFEWLELQKVNERVLFVIMLFVAFFNLSTVMIILILDRVKMIGVLKSLGARTSDVMKVFLYMMARIILYGFIAGNLLALTLAWIQDRFRVIKLSQADYYLSFAPVAFDPMKMFLINIFAFVLILLFMVIPAFVVAGIRPIRALRFG